MTEMSTLEVGPLLEDAVVDVVIPVHNEERALERSVRRLRTYLDERFPFSALVTIVDNASTDQTGFEADLLADELAGVRVIHLAQKGKGRAIRAAWSESGARVLAYMDVDLATDLDALLPLVAPLLSGHSDIAVGSRLARGARVVRGPKRELISRSYNVLLRAVLRSPVSDVACGFKAVNRDTVTALLPLIDDDGWFFDTELLILAQRNRLRIHEIPVDWVDDPDSRVDIARTAIGDLRGVWRLVRALSAGRGYADSLRSTSDAPTVPAAELARFAGVGVVSTAAYLALFAALLVAVGPFVGNALALAICVLGNSVAHARLTSRPPEGVRWTSAIAGGSFVLLVTGLLTTAGLEVSTVVHATSTLDFVAAVSSGPSWQHWCDSCCCGPGRSVCT